MTKVRKTFFLILFLLFSYNKIVKAETLTFPTNLVANTTDFVLLSTSGTTPSISGYSGTLIFSAVASSGNVKVTTTSNLLRAKGYCGYTSDASTEPTNCSGNSLTEVGFRGTQDDINVAIATLSFKGDGSTGSPTITVSITPAGTNYFSGNGHYYEIVNAEKTWPEAKAAAEASTLYGLSGYLATITSQAENDFLDSKVGQDTWIGGSDSSTYTSNSHPVTEGTWEWVSGPDNGNTFFCQTAVGSKADDAHADCALASGYEYNSWRRPEGQPSKFEPNDHPTDNPADEDCAHMRSDGDWNDYKCDRAGVMYYIIEYGGTDGESATTTGVVNLRIESIEASDSTYNVFDDQELVGIVDAQNESATRFARNIMDSVLDRLHEFRLRKNNKGFKNNEISLQVNLDEIGKNYQDIINHYASKGLVSLANYVQNKKVDNTKENDWQFWINGKISTGRTDLKLNNLAKENEMDSITIGFDKLKNNTLFGIALNIADDKTDIGNHGSNLKMRGENLIVYSAWNSKSLYLDSVLGYGALKSLTERVVDRSNTSNLVIGDRKSEQFYGTTYLNYIKNIDKFDLQLFSGLDYIYTDFNGYSESGNNQKLKFKPHTLTNYTSSIGSTLFYRRENEIDKHVSFLKFEYKKDHSEKASIQANLISDSTEKLYTYNYVVPYSYFMKIETGYNYNTDRGLNVYTKLGRIQKSNDDFENIITIEFSQSF